jgi:hypothetical protein
MFSSLLDIHLLAFLFLHKLVQANGPLLGESYVVFPVFHGAHMTVSDFHCTASPPSELKFKLSAFRLILRFILEPVCFTCELRVTGKCEVQIVVLSEYPVFVIFFFSVLTPLSFGTVRAIPSCFRSLSEHAAAFYTVGESGARSHFLP